MDIIIVSSVALIQRSCMSSLNVTNGLTMFIFKYTTIVFILKQRMFDQD